MGRSGRTPGAGAGKQRRLRVLSPRPTPAALARPRGRAAARAALVEVDDERHAIHPEPRAEAVLEEVGVVARDAAARVDLNGEARRRGADLRHIQELQAVALLGRRLTLLD